MEHKRTLLRCAGWILNSPEWLQRGHTFQVKPQQPPLHPHDRRHTELSWIPGVYGFKLHVLCETPAEWCLKKRNDTEPLVPQQDRVQQQSWPPEEADMHTGTCAHTDLICQTSRLFPCLSFPPFMELRLAHSVPNNMCWMCERMNTWSLSSHMCILTPTDSLRC